jgi:hypothetical protein
VSEEGGALGDEAVRERVIERLLEVSQTCHSSGGYFKPNTMLCRGARTYQNEMMHRLGVIDSPSDEAWNAKRAEYGV